MQAIILAAGMGKRLKDLTHDNTKCMVKVNGVSLIERMLRILDTKKLSGIIIVIGYCGEKLKIYISGLNIRTHIVYINNDVYDKTNNIYSLSLAKEYLENEDTILLESDLIFDESIIDRLIDDQRKNLAVVAKFEDWMDGTCLELDDDDNITNFIPGRMINFLDKARYYKTANIYKFSKQFSRNVYIPFLNAYRKAKGENEFYESVIKLIAMLGTDELQAMRLNDEIWYEIDDALDLDIAESLFADSLEDKYKMIAGRFGGYWRYPKLKDFCYLVNPFFPTKRMMREIESNLEALIRGYPSGMRVNTLLGSRNFNVKQGRLVIGNGAAELIKTLLSIKDFGVLGIVRPTFEEYPRRYERSKMMVYTSDNEGFRYNEDDLISYFGHHKIDTLVLINPDNPSGNYIANAGIDAILQWTKKKGLSLIVDESFADFVGVEAHRSLIDDDILSNNKQLYAIKSISKSYGVPGIRLGVLASSDEETIGAIRENLPIWNINSIAEFFMQIYMKYDNDYQTSLGRIIDARESFASKLNKIPYLQVYKSEANYIMCKVLRGTSQSLAEYLLHHNMLIKDLTSKIGSEKQYIRVAVRNDDENALLVKALSLYANHMEEKDNG